VNHDTADEDVYPSVLPSEHVATSTWVLLGFQIGPQDNAMGFWAARRGHPRVSPRKEIFRPAEDALRAPARASRLVELFGLFDELTLMFEVVEPKRSA